MKPEKDIHHCHIRTLSIAHFVWGTLMVNMNCVESIRVFFLRTFCWEPSFDCFGFVGFFHRLDNSFLEFVPI